MPSLANRLRAEGGIVALETLFSVIMVFTTTFMFFGVAAMLHNQAVLNGATQLASQESLMAYDRFTYSEGAAGRRNLAIAEAANIANDVYREGAHGLIDDQFQVSQPAQHIMAMGFDLKCAPDYATAADGGGSAGSCGATDASGRIETVIVSGGAPAATWLTDPLNGIPYTRINNYLSSSAKATSGGPCTRAESDIYGYTQCQ